MNASHGREMTPLTTKMSSTFSEGFSNQYNSPKTFNGKGFALSKSPNPNPTLYPRRQKETTTLTQTKTKAAKGPTSVPENKTLGQKTLSNSALNYQASGVKDEKRSSSKLKCETLRTVSSTPKNPLAYKGAESVRRDENDLNSNQPRWKKLEISTEFSNVKNSYALKAQTTKHTEAEENAKESMAKTQVKQASMNNLQKSQNLTGYNFYTQQNAEEAKARADKILVDTKARTPRPLTTSTYGSSAKNSSTSPHVNPKGMTRTASVKDNMKLTTTSFPSEREKSASKLSYRKDKPAIVNATPKASLTSLANEESVSNTASKKYLGTANSPYANEPVKAKARPLSAKKVPKETKEDLAAERASSKDDKTPTQKVSLQSFVTKVNKGDVFSSITKYSENKRESSAKRTTQKPQLNIDDKSAKSVRAIDIDLKGNKTTTNSEVRGLNGNLTKSSVQLSPSQPTQALVQKTTKGAKYGNTPTKEAQRAAIADVPHLRTQARDPFVYYMTGLEKAHRWTGGSDYFAQLYREHFLQSFQALNFVKSLKPVDHGILAQKRVHLPKKDIHKDKKTLIFDMDETLIHCNESTDMPADVILPISFPTGEVIEAGINVRPYAVECLRELSQHYEIVVFTASHACYANVVLDYLDPRQEYIQHRLFRESCVVTEEGVHIKDLRVIGNRNMSDLILVDNAAYSFGLQIENGIPIIPFYESKNDQELKHLIPYLKFLSSVKDIRDIIKQTFRMHQYCDHDTPDTVLEKVVFQA